MIRSMTGFGQAGRNVHDYKIQIDIKSVNHRYQETMIRMPREWMHLEDAIKKSIQQRIKRGRIDVFVTMEKEATAAQLVEINWTLAEGLQQAANQLSERLNLPNDLSVKEVLSLPDVIRFKDGDADSVLISEQMLGCVEDALSQLVAMREIEGSNLSVDLHERIETLKQLHQVVAAQAPQSHIEHRDKLRQRIQDLLADATMDEQRFTMEVAMMAERASIDEELTRLSSHVQQCQQLLATDDPVGRKLDFLIQEMNREVNTIGSKSNHTIIASKVVELKAELEKIREQVQNIE